MSLKRDAYIAWMTSMEGAPYLWGADGETVPVPGLGDVPAFDCSGLALAGLKAIGGPDWGKKHNCASLWTLLPPPVPSARAGDLCFYGPKDAPVHCMVLMPDGRVYGASGGNSSTLRVEDALRIGAKVSYRAKPDYRRDLLGYRTLAKYFDEET